MRLNGVGTDFLKGDTMDEVYDFLKKCGTYYVATIDGDWPRVRAFGTIHKFEDKLYIQSGRSKAVYKQILANPHTEIIAFDNKDTWVRIDSTLVEDPRIEAEQALLDDYPSLAGRYAAGDGNNVVFYMKDATATFSSFSGESHTVEF